MTKMSESLSSNNEALEPPVAPVESQASSPIEVEEVSFNKNRQGLQHDALARQGAKAESHLLPLQVLIPIVVQVDTRKRLTSSPRQSKRIAQQYSGV